LLRPLGLLMMDETPKNRRSIRLKGFDYSLPGAYFLTICTHRRERILASVVDRKIQLSPAGAVVRSAWLELPRRFPTVMLQDFVVMPNHLHAIVAFAHLQHATKKGAASSAPTTETPSPPYLGKIIRAFKSLSAIEVNRILGRKNRAVWQRNYYEHIIRTAREYDEIRKYIYENPMMWDHDPENV
jgi:REP element-mobilizing transposase RayT